MAQKQKSSQSGKINEMAVSIPNRYYFSLQKRVFDLLVSSSLLIFLSPILVLIGFLVKIGSKGPIIYKQKRIGLKGKVFTIFKFRTMYLGAERDRNRYHSLNISPNPTFKIINDPRFVGIGSWLSHTGLDELPQLFNVIIGDMSLVGPRPFPVDETHKLPLTWHSRYLVKPGILSSWAVSDRSKITQSRWIKLDRSDLKNASFSRDLHLLIKAIKHLLLPR